MVENFVGKHLTDFTVHGVELLNKEYYQELEVDEVKWESTTGISVCRNHELCFCYRRRSEVETFRHNGSQLATIETR